jgi:hypothetical protein
MWESFDRRSEFEGQAQTIHQIKRSKYQCALRVEYNVNPYMFHSTFPTFAEVIEAEAVRLLVDQSQQSVAKQKELRWVYPTLKDRGLHTLSVIFASLCDSAQTASAFESCCRNVVTDYNQNHAFLDSAATDAILERVSRWEIDKENKYLPTRLLPEECRVAIKVPAKMTRQQQ